MYERLYDKSKELLYLKHCDVNNFYGRAISQEYPVNSFGWIKNNFSI